MNVAAAVRRKPGNSATARIQVRMRCSWGTLGAVESVSTCGAWTEVNATAAARHERSLGGSSTWPAIGCCCGCCDAGGGGGCGGRDTCGGGGPQSPWRVRSLQRVRRRPLQRPRHVRRRGSQRMRSEAAVRGGCRALGGGGGGGGVPWPGVLVRGSGGRTWGVGGGGLGDFVRV